jgi:RimJ/RimL family protein N-acetyltransferase
VIQIRRASVDDAPGIAHIMEVVAAERAYSAIDRAWTVDEQRSYLKSLTTREALHVASAESGGIIGCQGLTRYVPSLPSMAHVGEVGTWVLPEWRGRGVGRRLFEATRSCAAQQGYRKLLCQVRASNSGALAFYGRMGFVECGRLREQVIIDGRADDEIMMELFLR